MHYFTSINSIEKTFLLLQIVWFLLLYHSLSMEHLWDSWNTSIIIRSCFLNWLGLKCRQIYKHISVVNHPCMIFPVLLILCQFCVKGIYTEIEAIIPDMWPVNYLLIRKVNQEIRSNFFLFIHNKTTGKWNS